MSAAPVELGIAFVLGAVLAAGYLAALWSSVRGLARSPRPGRHLLGGAALRVGLLVGGLYLVGDGRWERLAACLLGFMAVRTVVTRRLLVRGPGAGRE